LKILRGREPYKSKYWDSDRGKWKISLDAVNSLMKGIKPNDDILRVLERVKTDHETQFFAEVDKPTPKKRRDLEEVKKILDSVGRQYSSRSG
jgi:hypothetical protein